MIAEFTRKGMSPLTSHDIHLITLIGQGIFVLMAAHTPLKEMFRLQVLKAISIYFNWLGLIKKRIKISILLCE